MSKKIKTTVAEAAIEPIVANGIEFSPKMIDDLTKIAQIEAQHHLRKRKSRLHRKRCARDDRHILNRQYHARGVRRGGLQHRHQRWRHREAHARRRIMPQPQCGYRRVSG